jgi:hypothetical protein
MAKSERARNPRDIELMVNLRACSFCSHLKALNIRTKEAEARRRIVALR